MLYSFFVFVVFVRGGFDCCFGGFGAVPVFLIFFLEFLVKRFFVFCFFIFPVFLFSFETPVRGLFNYKLDNGLDVYILENSSVPLVYIEVLIKGGGFGQSEENAGLFHLYEHMMFKGNELYPDSSKVQDAIASLGVPSWNGSTSTLVS